MATEAALKYQAKLSRARVRDLYLLVEQTSPTHKASLAWLTAAAGELADLAQVSYRKDGKLEPKPLTKEKVDEVIEFGLSRQAVLGVKFASGVALSGGKLALITRKFLLTSLDGIADGKVRRLVEKEFPLPESDDLEEGKELDEE
jgi:hypothetical protein